MVIDVEFSRKNHDSIPTTPIESGLESLNVRTDF
jgi:hypothetical protein